MTIHIDDDMDLAKIAESGQCFRWQRLGENTWRIPSMDRCLIISDKGDGDFEADCTEEEFDKIWSPYFDLHTSYRDVRDAIDPKKEPFLKEASDSEQGIRILRQDLWETLISFIISQNRNIPAISRSIELLCKAASSPKTDSKGEEYYPFPSPEEVAAMSDEALGSCALGYRDRYIRLTAEQVASGAYSLEELTGMSDENSLERLMELTGVGVKVANCVLLFGLHRLDAFPIDVWMKRILADKYPGGYPMEEHRPWNGIYQQYMFAYYRKL